jgi:serine/threonine protein kinase
MTSNKNKSIMEQDKKDNNNNFISISDNIEESIHSHFSNYGNKFKSDSKKISNNSQKSSVNNNKNSYKSSTKSKNSKKNKSNKFVYDTINNINFSLDNIVGKIVKGKLFCWVVGDILYESGNSTIYKAFNINDGNIFVVKKYNCVDGIKCDNYINEVKIYKNLNHKNIIKYIYSEQINNYYFLYLEYIKGGSIKNLIDQFGGFNESLIKIYTKQILEGLKYLHDNKIIHRDIKCANILIGDKGIIKLTDFGCSKTIIINKKDSSSNEEYCTSLKGTIPWCAPEVICHKKYGKKADIWSLGCTLIEMTGHKPWGNIENIYQIMNKIGKSNLTPEIPDCLSDNFKNFLDLCLKRDPKKRANLKTLLKHNFITGYYL